MKHKYPPPEGWFACNSAGRAQKAEKGVAVAVAAPEQFKMF